METVGRIEREGTGGLLVMVGWYGGRFHGWEVYKVGIPMSRKSENEKSYMTIQPMCRSFLDPQITRFDGSHVYLGWVVGQVVTNGRLLERGDP